MEHAKKLAAGTGEKTQYLVHDFNDNTIRFILHYPGRPDSAVLCAAVGAVIRQTEILHSSFCVGTTRAEWKVNEEYAKEDYFRVTEIEKNLQETACRIAAQPILPEDTVQLQCHLLQNSESVLVVRISHLCVDGSDGKYVLAKIVRAYCMLCENGSADNLAVKNGSRRAEQAYEKLSRKECMTLLRNPIPKVKSVFPFPAKEASEAEKRVVYRVLSESVMQSVKEKAGRVHATVNDALLAACYHAYAHLPGCREDMAMSIMSMMDLRRHCINGDSEGLCNITGSLPTVLPEGIKDSLEKTLVQIAAQTRAWKEDPYAGLEGMPLLHGVVRTFPMGMLRVAAKHVYGSMAVGLTNLGVLTSKEFALGNLEPDMAIFGGPLKKKPSMQVSAISLGEQCVLSVAGEMTAEDEALVEQMLERMCFELEKFAEG